MAPYCDACGLPVRHVADLVPVRRAGGVLHVHPQCAERGTVGVGAQDVVASVRRDRAVYSGGPRAVEVPRR